MKLQVRLSFAAYRAADKSCLAQSNSTFCTRWMHTPQLRIRRAHGPMYLAVSASRRAPGPDEHLSEIDHKPVREFRKSRLCEATTGPGSKVVSFSARPTRLVGDDPRVTTHHGNRGWSL